MKEQSIAPDIYPTTRTRGKGMNSRTLLLLAKPNLTTATLRDLASKILAQWVLDSVPKMSNKCLKLGLGPDSLVRLLALLLVVTMMASV